MRRQITRNSEPLPPDLVAHMIEVFKRRNPSFVDKPRRRGRTGHAARVRIPRTLILHRSQCELGLPPLGL